MMLETIQEHHCKLRRNKLLLTLYMKHETYSIKGTLGEKKGLGVSLRNTRQIILI